jgi:hypothetical protein
MGVEDQQEEREVLESIFPEEIIGMAGYGLPAFGAWLTASAQMFPRRNSAC